jgi:hypothetical protein
MQYLFDINAWGKLAGMPVALAGLAFLLTIMTPPPGYTEEKRAADFLSIATLFVIVVAGAIYYYPEMIPLFGCAALGATLAWVIVTRRQLELANLLPALVGMVVAALVYLFFGQGALGYFIREVGGPVGAKVDWWKYFQAYLITRPTDFPTAAMGLYFILPPKLPALVVVPWRLSVYLLTAAVLISAAIAWARADVSRNRAVLLLGGTLCTLALIAAMALTGRFWWAGSGLAMLAPILFGVLVSPLLLPRTLKACRMVGLSFAGTLHRVWTRPSDLRRQREWSGLFMGPIRAPRTGR